MATKILVIEDEPVLLEALAKTFEKEGFEVLTATDGKEGLDVSLGTHPDIILLDILMPVMDGTEMLDKLRCDSWGKKARVLILTNLSDLAREAKSNSQGVLQYLIKSNLGLKDTVDKVKKSICD